MTAEPRRPRDLAALVPAAAVAVLLAACIVASEKKFFGLDELYSWTLLTDPSWWHMVRALAAGNDGAPPLYHTLGRAWVRVAGADELSLRLFSSLGFCAAVVLTWRTLREEYGARAASVGVLTVFCASPLVLEQNAEGRFYGLLTGLTAAAIHLFHVAARQPGGTLRAYVATALVHAGLVLCHVYGGLYSIAILAALVAWDRVHGRFRPAWYGAIVAGWAAFVPWLGPFLVQSMQWKPHSWIPVPTLGDLVGMYEFRNRALAPVIVAVFALHFIARRAAPRNGDGGQPAPGRTLRASPLLFVAAALLAVPIVSYLKSQVGVSIFWDRYFLPASIAWAILLAHVVAMLAASRGEVTPPDTARPAGRPLRVLLALGWGAVYALLLVYPLRWARAAVFPAVAGAPMLPDAAAAVPADVPIVVEWVHSYLPATHYALPGSRERGARIAARRGDSPRHVGLERRLLFVLDSAVALDPRSEHSEIVDYRMLGRRREYYDDPGIVTVQELLCTHDRFAVLDVARSRWYEQRIRDDPAFESRVVYRHSIMELVLVRRVAPLAGALAELCGHDRHPA